MNFNQALRAARGHPNDAGALATLARHALVEGREDLALPLISAAAERGRAALLWQWRGLLERSLDDHERALASFDRAAALAPSDLSIAHGRARVALEAGVPAEHLFAAALRLSPANPDVVLGYAAALLAAGDQERAEATLQHALGRLPLWIEGHVQLAQLRSTIGRTTQATAVLEQAIQRHPTNGALQLALFQTLVRMQQFEALDAAMSRARGHLHQNEEMLRYEAIAAAEQQDILRADRLFAAMSPPVRQSSAIWLIRHCLRTGRLAEALRAIDAALATDAAPDVWPYAALAWRLAGDPRWRWLEGDLDRLVAVVDITSELADLQSLEGVLRTLHAGRGEYLDQSVRGGSQTDGPLFTNINPHLRLLRQVVVRAVRSYIEQLPDLHPGHPLLGWPRDRRIRFAGSWSVLLRNGGHHANHVHPQGWISSALYIRVPEHTPGDPFNAGWLILGEPQAELNLSVPALQEIKPKPGQLVLFPSYMWHGTRPFAEGERLTVAFDVQRPF